jgi:hypothetical protein
MMRPALLLTRLARLEKTEVHMRKKLAGLGLIVAFAAAAVTIWAKSPAFTRQAQAIPEATQISPHELQLRIDTKSLPVQEIGDPI